MKLVRIEGNEATIEIDGRTHFVPFVAGGGRVQFAFEGEIYTVELPERGRARARKHADHSLEAPMPGLVLKVLFGPGDKVEKGAQLVILEAMKMEHAIVAPRDGTIAAVNCREGEMVQPGVELVTLQ